MLRCYVVNRTVDDISSITEDEPPAPAIVMVANGPAPTSLVLTVPAEFERRIAAGGKTHEIDDERMSRDHALVTTERGSWVISDRDSRNGTFVDGEHVQGEVAAGEVDKDTVVAALARASNVVSVAARALGLHRTQLYRLMEKYGIARGDDA
jgi:DNA-binding NtrC family response regulator